MVMGREKLSQGANESTALPCFNDMHIVSETIGCFGRHPTRLTPMVFQSPCGINGKEGSFFWLAIKGCHFCVGEDLAMGLENSSKLPCTLITSWTWK